MTNICIIVCITFCINYADSYADFYSDLRSIPPPYKLYTCHAQSVCQKMSTLDGWIRSRKEQGEHVRCAVDAMLSGTTLFPKLPSRCWTKCRRPEKKCRIHCYCIELVDLAPRSFLHWARGFYPKKRTMMRNWSLKATFGKVVWKNTVRRRNHVQSQWWCCRSWCDKIYFNDSVTIKAYWWTEHLQHHWRIAGGILDLFRPVKHQYLTIREFAERLAF